MDTNITNQNIIIEENNELIENGELIEQLNIDEHQIQQNNTEKKQQKQKITKEFEISKRLKRSKQVIEQQEKSQEIFSQQPQKSIILVHFGIGDENDYNTILQIFQIKPKKLVLYPGLSYSYIEFENEYECEQKLRSISQEIKDEKGCFYLETTEKKPRIFIFMYNMLPLGQIGKSKMNEVPNSLEKVDVSGIIYIEDFITQAEEKFFIEQIDSREWIKLTKRQVQHYGYEFIYGPNTINKEKKANPIPDFFNEIKNKLNEIIKDKQSPLDQLTINDYNPGDGIAAHFDSHSPFEECIVVISLLSGVAINFKSYKNEEVSLFLKPRSLLIMSGEGRYAWTHCIPNRKVDRFYDEIVFRRRRVSLTFRTVRFQPCNCSFKFFCDDQGYDPITMKKENPLLEQFLKNN